MADEHSRDYEDDYSPDSGDEGMESEHNSGAEDGAPDGAGMDSEISRHGELSASKQLETENDSDNSDDSINHTPAFSIEGGKFRLISSFFLLYLFLRYLISMLPCQDYKSRDGTGGHRIYVCPFSNLCNCPVRFRIVNHGCVTRLQIDGKHDANSHAADHSRGLNLKQRAAVQSSIYSYSASSRKDRTVLLTSDWDCVAKEIASQVFQ
jgi:hypothetical protein